MDEMTAENPTRRGFLGMFAAALVMPVAMPVIAPKRSFFSFFVPNRLIHPDEFDLQAEIDALSNRGGGVLRIPEGVYRTGKSIVLPDDVSFAFVGKGVLSDCYFKGKSKGTKDPRGIFVAEEDNKEESCLLIGCRFDMTESARPAVEIVFAGSAGEMIRR